MSGLRAAANKIDRLERRYAAARTDIAAGNKALAKALAEVAELRSIASEMRQGAEDWRAAGHYAPPVVLLRYAAQLDGRD